MDPLDMLTNLKPRPTRPKDKFDSLSLFHHVTYAFEPALNALGSILDKPKEFQLNQRFQEIESLLDKTLCLELVHHLHLIKQPEPDLNNSANIPTYNPPEQHFSHPQILLHLSCFLECTDSLENIANYLEITVDEVQELIRELHHTFSIDSLRSRIQQYYEENKATRERSDRLKRSELLETETTLVPQDTTEDRKQRLRKRYGPLGAVFDRIFLGSR